MSNRNAHDRAQARDAAGRFPRPPGCPDFTRELATGADLPATVPASMWPWHPLAWGRRLLRRRPKVWVLQATLACGQDVYWNGKHLSRGISKALLFSSRELAERTRDEEGVAAAAVSVEVGCP